MTKSEIEAIATRLRKKYKDEKDGNSFYEQLVEEINPIVKNDRKAVIEVVGQWLMDLSDPMFYFSIDLIGDFRLFELKGHLIDLREQVIKKDIENRVPKLQWIDRALTKFKN